MLPVLAGLSLADLGLEQQALARATGSRPTPIRNTGDATIDPGSSEWAAAGKVDIEATRSGDETATRRSPVIQAEKNRLSKFKALRQHSRPGRWPLARSAGDGGPRAPTVGFGNAYFATGDFFDWTVANTPDGAGAPGSVVMHDIDGSGLLEANCAARFSVGREDYFGEEGVTVTQVLTLEAGVEYTFEYHWSTNIEPGLVNGNGGIFYVIVDGVTIASHDSGDIGYGGVTEKYGHISGQFTPNTTGTYEVGAMITRLFYRATGLYQYVDNFSPSLDPPGSENCSWGTGACCQGDGTCIVQDGPTCTGSGGEYYGDGTSCDPNPCLQPEGNDCMQPVVVTLPADLPYTNGNTTCGRGDDYDDTCLGDWDGGEDLLYELIVTEDTCVGIVVTDQSTYGGWFGFAVDDVCPPSLSDCIATATAYAEIAGLTDVFLTAGTYFVMVDTWPPPDCFGNLTLTITACPTGACCTATPDCFVTHEDTCLAAAGTYLGDETACGGDCDGDGVGDACAIAAGAADCQPNSIPDDCDIDSATSDDLDGNGVPDECDRDCNENGIPDGCDVSCQPSYCSANYPNDCGLSQDCQPDLIPDECPNGLPGSGLTYLHDDGTYEYLTGQPGPPIDPPAYTAWLNHFTTEVAAETITSISLTWGRLDIGTPATIYLWNDPNGDGDPADATVLASADTVSQYYIDNTFQIVDLPDTFVGPAGTSFFVGAIVEHDGFAEHPVMLDENDPQGESWLAGNVAAPIDPNNLGGVYSTPVTPISEIVGDFNLMVRAAGVCGTCGADCNSNDIPDDCDIAGGAADCDENGVPDICEVAERDCQPNGIVDACDIAAGTSTDLNSNGLPDDCEDCNTNSIPDEMDLVPGGGNPVNYQVDIEPDAAISSTLPPTVSVFNIADLGIIADLDVQVFIDHTWVSDLTIEIEHNGTTVVLSDRHGGDGDDYDGTIFDDEADTPISEGTAPFAGLYMPDQTLSAFDDTDVLGDWTLTVTDHYGGDDGTLNAWTVYSVSGAAPAFSQDCNENGKPDECDIAEGASQDCQPNGIPDECDLAGGTSDDCNDNDIPDECDLANCGGSAWCDDCQPDGILDICQLGGGARSEPFIYQWDDGAHENTIGLTGGGYIAWMSHFTIEAGAETITAISLTWGPASDGTPATVYLWDDPDGDGDPIDGTVLASATTAVENSDTDIFTTADIAETFVGPVGTSFFVGAILQHAAGEYPASLDQTTPQGRSWIAGHPSSIDPDRLGDLSLPPAAIGSTGFPGNWLLRADAASAPNDCNANGVPDDSDPIAAGDFARAAD
ncbi:MAG: hypothetical protein GY778_30445, partial [bacterium]|nr:hypothetical protein [bacterium]